MDMTSQPVLLRLSNNAGGTVACGAHGKCVNTWNIYGVIMPNDAKCVWQPIMELGTFGTKPKDQKDQKAHL
jgi:hypothetical protein